MLNRLLNRLNPFITHINLHELDQLSEEQKQKFGYFLYDAKQKADAIYYADTPYKISGVKCDGSVVRYLIMLDTSLVCYSRKNNPGDKRFAVLGKRVGYGAYGSVFESGESLSVELSDNVIRVRQKQKIENKLRAVKFQKFFTRNQQIEMLAEAECRLTRMASSESKVKILVRDAERQKTAMVMHYHMGEDLFDMLNKDKLTNDVDRIDICLSIAENLARIHAGDVIHRDLKPENIKLKRGAEGRYQATIFDFGLATSVTNPDFHGCGTPEYAAPEMFLRSQLIKDRKCMNATLDIYSLGRVFETVFGKMPSWPAGDISAVVRHHSDPFDATFTRHVDAENRKILEANGLFDLFRCMRAIDPANRIVLSDVITCLKSLRATLPDSACSALSVTTQSLFASSAAAAAAAAAADSPSALHDDDKTTISRKCS